MYLRDTFRKKGQSQFSKTWSWKKKEKKILKDHTIKFIIKKHLKQQFK